jgi:hypothetical protein
MIKIEVTGNSIPEVADKLLAIGASLRASAAIETPRGATKSEAEVAEIPARKTPPKKEEVMPEVVVVHSPIEDEPLEVIDLPVADTPTIDVETDIRPLILEVVTKRGKPFMEDILSSFGVVKASHLEPALLPKLIDRCNEALVQ